MHIIPEKSRRGLFVTKILSLFLLSFLSIPAIVSAHVKWFAKPVDYVRPYQIDDMPVIITLIVCLVAVCVGVYLDRKLTVPKWIGRFVSRWASAALSIASIGFGLSFIIFSLKGFIFAPNLPATPVLLVIQCAAGLMIFLGLFEKVGGFLLVVLFWLSMRQYGFMEMMDAFEMLGFALYAIIVGRPKWRIVDVHIFTNITHRLHAYGVPLLRVATGLNLMILGFSEKIMAPSLTQDFLNHYDWNFMHHVFGFEWFTDYWFAFSAGSAEILIGLFLILGLTTRITVIALAVFLVTTLTLLGPIELIGHLPHFSIAIVLLVMGAGARLKFGKKE
ncbi:MAG: DoxX family membrane protein [Candidatus Pacebacteria bacterium]|nr:DoxX family membrane protein [Candidatus Paceibacterota bacterium]